MKMVFSLKVKPGKIFLGVFFLSIHVVFVSCGYSGDDEPTGLAGKLNTEQQSCRNESSHLEAEVNFVDSNDSNNSKYNLDYKLDMMAKRKVSLYGHPQLALSKERLEVQSEKQKMNLTDFHQAGQRIGNARIRIIGRTIVFVVIAAGLMMLTLYIRKSKIRRRFLKQRQVRQKMMDSKTNHFIFE